MSAAKGVNLAVRFLLELAALAALLLAGHPGWAATMAAVVVVNEALLFAWRQREH